MEPKGHQSWFVESVQLLRSLSSGWDDRHGAELEGVSGEERSAVLQGRMELLSTVGRLMIKAILDYDWRVHPLALELEDWANRARHLERTKPYENAAVCFFGMLVEWCRGHADMLPKGTPALEPLNSQTSGFVPIDVPRKRFADACDAFACLLQQGQPIAIINLEDPIPIVEIVEIVSRKAGRSDKLAERMRRRNYPVEKRGGKLHCRRADAIALYPRYRSAIEEICSVAARPAPSRPVAARPSP